VRQNVNQVLKSNVVMSYLIMNIKDK
jgi:hypothetical protein